MLRGKKIILGVSASIASYKSAFLVRLLVKEGAEVKVIMTPAAHDFITPLTLSTLSHNPVLTEFTLGKTGEWNNHVELGLWADLILIAPASANTLSKMASGLCDNLLLAVYLSARCQVYFAPAMDLDMYKHSSTLENLNKLKSRGNILLKPGTGELASGLSGEGRMAEPAEILELVTQNLLQKAPFHSMKALVTAGPTHEAIDPVRFIGNHSSGKMGFAIAEELADRGAVVCLVCGPNALKSTHPLIKRIDVVSAEEMYQACLREFSSCQVAVLAAAVADYRPKEVADHKIKKKGEEVPLLELEQTRDILAELGRMKSDKQVLVGFALETDAELENAKAKLFKKNLDFIVLNSLRDAGAGFGTDTNKITIIDRNNKTTPFELKDKQEAAKDITDALLAFVNSKK
jgi:phosphopantothenoylcysteine decarboxylase/phosphopantothenate--cysteine ligase